MVGVANPATHFLSTPDHWPTPSCGIIGVWITSTHASLSCQRPSRQNDDDIDEASRREAYSLTVEDVAVRLADENLYRDPRTIQRWCKARRLDCILDSENGERYLVEPTSVEKMVATLVRDRDRRSRQDDDVPRPVERHRDNAAMHDATRPEAPRESAAREAGASDAQAEPASAGKDLKARVSELETELAIAKADKQAREAMVNYMKEQFEGMIDNAMERAEEVGQLRAENTQLNFKRRRANRN